MNKILLNHYYQILFRTPDDLEDVSKYPNLFAVLLERNWKEEDLIKLAGGNILRVFKGVEEVGGVRWSCRVPVIVQRNLKSF